MIVATFAAIAGRLSDLKHLETFRLSASLFFQFTLPITFGHLLLLKIYCHNLIKRIGSRGFHSKLLSQSWKGFD